MAQSPESSEYDGMPRSAISTGLVDFILPPDELRVELVRYISRDGAKSTLRSERPVSGSVNESLQKVFQLVRRRTGHDFSLYKPSTILRRLERRLSVHQIDNLDDYVLLLQRSDDEVETLFREFLIRVSSFFRDKAAFDAVADTVMPELLPADIDLDVEEDMIRIWVPGCSTGEEAYSIAMLARERMDVIERTVRVQVFATDVDREALSIARNGIYPENIAVDISPDRLQRFFSKQGSSYLVDKHIRDMVVFAPHSLIKDPPFSRMNFVSCRNVLIYMGNELQDNVLPLFHYSLLDGGYLLLGSSETIGGSTDLFRTADQRAKLYQRRIGSGERISRLSIPVSVPRADLPRVAAPSRSLDDTRKGGAAEVASRVLLQTWAPNAVLVNEHDEILYYHGHCGRYLDPSTGEATNNLFRLIVPQLKQELTTALFQAKNQNTKVRRKPITMEREGLRHSIAISVLPVREPPEAVGLMVVAFEQPQPSAELPPSKPAIEVEEDEQAGDGADQGDPIVLELRRELKETREALNNTVEELQVSNEELQSYNEELQSSNEELQISNEELDTSREELQSVNEELETVNAELTEKNAALAELNSDMNNLLTSTDIGMVVLDEELTVQRFTPAAQRLIPLIASDIGRPITDIFHRLNYPSLADDARMVLAEMTRREQEVASADGGWFSVRIMPYRTVHSGIRGVVLTLVEITEHREAVERLRQFGRALDQSMHMVMITDTDGNIEYVNPRFTEITGYEQQEVEGSKPSFLAADNMADQDWQQVWNRLRSGQTWDGVLHNQRKDGGRYWDYTLISPLKNEDRIVTHFVAVKDDITTKYRAQVGLKHAEAMFEALVDWMRQVVVAKESEEKLLGELCRSLVSVINYQSVWIGERADGDDWMRPLAATGVSMQHLLSLCSRPNVFEKPVFEKVLEGKGTQVVDYPLAAEDFGDGVETILAADAGATCFVSVPIHGEQGIIGALNLYCADAELFDDRQKALQAKMAEQIAWGMQWLRSRSN